mmetsp:Transcript_28794/g.82436  ORF Transcript_28794/g.82436 Transcript_28794/m.82436 type:complete len:641 (+) Transcript_28794:202-2124(+)
MRQAALLAVALAAAVATAEDLDTLTASRDLEHFDADDECVASATPADGSTSKCALNALQRSGVKAHALRDKQEAEGRRQHAAEHQTAGVPPVLDAEPEPDDEAAGPNATDLQASAMLWGSCAAYGCTGYVSWHGCQCNPYCGSHGNCCYDYARICVHRPAPHPPAPHPAPRPAPRPPAPTCTASWKYNCLGTKKCCDPGMTCYEKNSGWAACLSGCAAGIHWNEPAQHRTPWSCKPLSGGHLPPAPQPHPPPAPTCSASYSGNCILTKKCCQEGFTCYAKNSAWAGCLPSCAPGIHWNDPPAHRTPWSCQIMGSQPLPPAPLPTSPPPLPTSPPEPPAPLPSTTGTVTDPGPGPNTSTSPGPSWYHIHNPQFAEPSKAPLYTFYMYRTQNNQNYPPLNQNLANVAGTLWYLHNEIVWHIPRRFNKTRIQRFKVQTRAPEALYEKGMNFGVRFAFDSGKCTGPFWKGGNEKSCNKDWDTYGYFVGCNAVGSYPTYQWRNKVHYQNAIWYSLPGACPDVKYHQHDATCTQQMPGGACPPGVTPTGTGDCTYTFEEAGEITISDLDGIGIYSEFIKAGGQEFNQWYDRGVHNSFWNYKYNDLACSLRVQAFNKLFSDKYPDLPKDEDLPPPICDFHEFAYYSS